MAAGTHRRSDVLALGASKPALRHRESAKAHGTNSVFRLAARRTELCAKAPQLETAPVSEKRVALSRCPRRPGYGRLTALDRLAVRAIGGFRSAGWHLLGHPPGFRVVSGGCARPSRPAPARRRPTRPKRRGPDLAGGSALRDLEGRFVLMMCREPTGKS